MTVELDDTCPPGDPPRSPAPGGTDGPGTSHPMRIGPGFSSWLHVGRSAAGCLAGGAS